MRGYIVHGGEFTNWIVFTGTDGHVVDTGNLAKGTWHFGDHIPPLHSGVAYHYTLHSNCTGKDGKVSPLCGWGQRVIHDGRSLMCEDAVKGDKPANQSYDDLQVHLDPGYGVWKPDGEISNTGWLEVPELCGPPPPPPPTDACEGVVCPPCHACVDGHCVFQCPDGKHCLNDHCVDCTHNDHCPEGHYCQNGVCVAHPTTPECGENTVWNGSECICKNGFVFVDGVCKPQCPPTPPSGGDAECNDDGDPCFGVICQPPRQCEGGACVCPDGTVDKGGMCVPADPCFGVLCLPNSSCEGGNCVPDDGYIQDENGNIVPDPDLLDPECIEAMEAEDCCPSNATIQIKAGKGLGGGGSFRLNQPCDKTIMLWLDTSAEEEECDEYGQANACTCNAEIAKLYEIVLDLKAELETVKEDAKKCAENNDC